MNSLELSQAHTALVKLRQSLTSKKDEGNVSMEPETFVQTLDETIAQIQSRLHGPQINNFSSATEETLQRLNIVGECGLALKPGHEQRAAEKSQFGRDKTWPSDALHCHMAFLKELVPSNESNMRFWIDAFLFRVSAMVPEDQSLVLNTKHGASATTITPSSIWSGYTDYTVVIADKKKAEFFLDALDGQEIRHCVFRNGSQKWGTEPASPPGAV